VTLVTLCQYVIQMQCVSVGRIKNLYLIYIILLHCGRFVELKPGFPGMRWKSQLKTYMQMQSHIALVH